MRGEERKERDREGKGGRKKGLEGNRANIILLYFFIFVSNFCYSFFFFFFYFVVYSSLFPCCIYRFFFSPFFVCLLDKGEVGANFWKCV